MNPAPRAPMETPCASSNDARGEVRYCNSFDMTPVRRFYTVRNSAAAPVRGWIVHLRENKWFYPVRGVTRIRTAPCPDPASAPPSAAVSESILRADAPSVLHVPPGNALAIVQDGSAEVLVFSDATLEESKYDVWRFDTGDAI